MDFSDDRRVSKNTVVGIGIVILLHILLVYALVSGLASSAIDIIKKPLEIKIIQEAPPTPPVPPPLTPPPPLLVTPPPPYIPPPIIQVQTPPPAQPVIAVTTSAKPPVAVSTAPAAPPSTAVGVVCPNVGAVAQKLSDSFQTISDDDNISNARVVVEFTVGANGAVSGARVLSSDSGDVSALALQGVRMLRCLGQGQAVQVEAPFEFQSN